MKYKHWGKWRRKNGVCYYNGNCFVYVIRQVSAKYQWPWPKYKMYLLNTSLQNEFGSDTTISFQSKTIKKLKDIVKTLETTGALTPVMCGVSKEMTEKNKRYCIRTYGWIIEDKKKKTTKFTEDYAEAEKAKKNKNYTCKFTNNYIPK